jgi:cytolethal distending toxin subunit A
MQADPGAFERPLSGGAPPSLAIEGGRVKRRPAQSALVVVVILLGLLNSGQPASAASQDWIRNWKSDLCLTINGGSTANNARAVQFGCDNHQARSWYAGTVGGGYFNIVNFNSLRCLTPAGGATGNNVQIVQYTCDGHRSRNWKFVSLGGTAYRIQNELSGKCLSPAGGSTATLANIVQYTCDTNTARKWYTSIL